MNLFAEASNRGIQTEFVDGQGHRRVTDAAALKIILNALPPPTPGPLIGQPVVVRSGRPAGSELRPAGGVPGGRAAGAAVVTAPVPPAPAAELAVTVAV